MVKPLRVSGSVTQGIFLYSGDQYVELLTTELKKTHTKDHCKANLELLLKHNYHRSP